MIKVSQFKDEIHQKEIILESFCNVDENFISGLENKEEVQNFMDKLQMCEDLIKNMVQNTLKKE